MINCSVSQRAVIGKEKEGIKRSYAYCQNDNYMDIEKFSEHISTHGSVYSEDIIEGVLKKAVKCMVEKFKEGYRIDLGVLGVFYPRIINKSWRELPVMPKDFIPSLHIQGINIVWERSEKLSNLGDDIEYNIVASRAAQAALLKAEKE